MDCLLFSFRHSFSDARRRWFSATQFLHLLAITVFSIDMIRKAPHSQVFSSPVVVFHCGSSDWLLLVSHWRSVHHSQRAARRRLFGHLSLRSQTEETPLLGKHVLPPDSWRRGHARHCSSVRVLSEPFSATPFARMDQSRRFERCSQILH